MNRIRVFCYVIGLLILSLGISLTIKADLGVGAWDALHVGLSKHFFTVGTWVIITGSILIVVNAILLKQRPVLLSMLTAFVMGVGIDLWLFILPFEPGQIGSKIVVFSIGLIVLAFGVSVYMQAKFAPAPIDHLMIAIHSRFHFKLSVSKTIGEVLALLLALLVRGPIGIGTIFVTFLVGPIIQVFYPKIEALVERNQKNG
ncbi:YitT family protein [Salinibacillus aidingensis]|uniref:YitT family protein n=1 Tax=Salinibacillus aidingensis TaxID=237684 RepID=A0ABP3LJF1_9BACI